MNQAADHRVAGVVVMSRSLSDDELLRASHDAPESDPADDKVLQIGGP